MSSFKTFKMDLTEILNKVDWKNVYQNQHGGRDEISATIVKGQIVVSWSNDNGWGHTTASGKMKMVYKDGSLAFTPNERVNRILIESGYYDLISKTN